jgi:membrane protein implicated in regulation of membrane protease activity
VGFSVSAISFLMGAVHIPHLPHFHFGGDGAIDGGGVHAAGHGHGGVLGHVHVDGGHAASGGEAASANEFHVSPFNLPTIMIFLAWFGGAGYLLTHYERIWGALAVVISVLVGLAGAAIVFWFMAKVLVSPEENLDPADYDMIGTLGRLSVGIREAGTGEIVYTQGGTRKCAAARSEDGRAIERGTEVVVTRYDQGIAYVRRWEELAGEEPGASEAQGAEQH